MLVFVVVFTINPKLISIFCACLMTTCIFWHLFLATSLAIYVIQTYMCNLIERTLEERIGTLGHVYTYDIRLWLLRILEFSLAESVTCPHFRFTQG